MTTRPSYPHSTTTFTTGLTTLRALPAACWLTWVWMTLLVIVAGTRNVDDVEVNDPTGPDTALRPPVVAALSALVGLAEWWAAELNEFDGWSRRHIFSIGATSIFFAAADGLFGWLSACCATSKRRSPISAARDDVAPVLHDTVCVELGDRFEVVGEAADAEGATDVINARQPDLVISDLHMPRGGGLAVVEACATVCPIAILTVSEAERDLLDGVAAGADGYLLKNAPIDEVRKSLVAAGEPVFSPSLAALVLGEFRRMAKSTDANPLTDRERQVLQLVARGTPTKNSAPS